MCLSCSIDHVSICAKKKYIIIIYQSRLIYVTKIENCAIDFSYTCRLRLRCPFIGI